MNDIARRTHILAALARGVTVDELALELEITPRHVRRIARDGGWAPPPRTYTGPRTLKISVSPEIYAALGRRGGRSVEDTAAALLAEVASADALQRQRSIAASSEVSPSWSAGYLDALVSRLVGVR